MAYVMYGGSAADFFADLTSTGEYLAARGAKAWVYDGNGGRRVTDLRDVNGVAITEVTTDSAANYQFQAPDTYGTLWIKPTAVGSRYYPVQPADIGSRLLALGTDLTEVNGKVQLQGAALEEIATGVPDGYRLLLVPEEDPDVPSVPVVDAAGVVTWVPRSVLGTGGGTPDPGPANPNSPATFAGTFEGARF